MDETKLKENLNLAIDAYIHRVDGCPCGSTSIHLFKGPQSKLPLFFGSKRSRGALKLENRELYNYFDRVWAVRNNHMIQGLPSCIFYLQCCFKPECTHPACTEGKNASTVTTWYSGGPPLTHLPLPVPDTLKPWGGLCSKCDVCAGHYIEPSLLRHY